MLFRSPISWMAKGVHVSRPAIELVQAHADTVNGAVALRGTETILMKSDVDITCMSIEAGIAHAWVRKRWRHATKVSGDSARSRTAQSLMTAQNFCECDWNRMAMGPVARTNSSIGDDIGYFDPRCLLRRRRHRLAEPVHPGSSSRGIF